MKMHLTILAALVALWIGLDWRRLQSNRSFPVSEFAQLPVLLNGRIQPLDSVARNALLQLRGTQSIPRFESGNGVRAIEWLLELLAQDPKADQRKVFRIHHPDLLRDLDLPVRRGKTLQFYSYAELESKLGALDREMERIRQIKPPLRNPLERELAALGESLMLYRRLKNSVIAESGPNPIEGLRLLRAAGLHRGSEAALAGAFSRDELRTFAEFLHACDRVSRLALPWVVPPRPDQTNEGSWANVGSSLLEAFEQGGVHPVAAGYLEMTQAFREHRPDRFLEALNQSQHWLAEHRASDLSKCRREYVLNSVQPFHRALMLYLLALVCACLSWIGWRRGLDRIAWAAAGIALLLHTGGLLWRMWLEGRPPVTNLYSSAVFVGWGGVVLGLSIERFNRDGIGLAATGAVGFLTLTVAHYLSLDADTLEMLRAVLDTNAWLATHVVIINLGYSATYLAGILSMIHLVRVAALHVRRGPGGTQPLNVPGRGKRSATDMIKTNHEGHEEHEGIQNWKADGFVASSSLSRAIYGIVCFAMLFSFVGTVLGGLWADQSWGRFWGWDPKENGALMIVIWNAMILHARWGGLIRERGLMAMAIFGNVITTWAYFGVNTLGIGLHAYGFMESSFRWVALFTLFHLLFLLALVWFGDARRQVALGERSG
jgi:ABC-type transport system involved in cytochrome c biogenesis permease subunit